MCVEPSKVNQANSNDFQFQIIFIWTVREEESNKDLFLCAA